MPTTQADIDDFLAHHRIAMVGVSRDPKDFSRVILRELSGRGYDVVPVNPLAPELDGRPCFSRVQDITPPVDGALLMTSPKDTGQVVRDCAEAGIGRVWMHRGAGRGAVNPEAVAFCKGHDMRVVEGHCPFMFLPNTPFFHRAHGFFLKLTGRYPRNRASL